MVCVAGRECKKDKILKKKTKKTGFFQDFGLNQGFFQDPVFFKMIVCYHKNCRDSDNIFKSRCVIKIDTLRYCRHVDCTLHGDIQKEEKPNFTILQIQVGFNSIKTVNTFALVYSHTE